MKQWIGILAFILLLSGCGEATPQSSDSEAVLPAVTLPAEPETGLYDPNHPVEEQTDGAVKAYSLGNSECISLAAMGEHYLLFGTNRLTLLTGENLNESATVEIADLPAPDSGMLQIKDDGIAYYDRKNQKVVFLNESLRQVGALLLTDTVTGGAYLTPDWTRLYYCTQAGVQVLNLGTGVSRLLKEQTAVWQSISGGFLDGTVLRCSMQLEDGAHCTILISAETGQTLAQGGELSSMTGSGDFYFLEKQTENDTEYIFGTGQEQPNLFLPAEPEALLTGKAIIQPSLQMGGVLQGTMQEDGILLDYYDLTTGRRTASLQLPGVSDVCCVSGMDGIIWLFQNGTLYRWETAMSPVEDTAVYTAVRYTREDPDEQGLAAIKKRLQDLQLRFGVEILYWDETNAVVPWDYSFVTEYRTEPYEEAIPALEEALSQFPIAIYQWMGNAPLKIVLVRGIYGGQDAEKYKPAAGIQYYLEGDAYIALSLGDGLEQNFYHEMGHVIDTRILSSCNAYSEWSTLNPKGFRYDNDYIKNQDRTDTQYLEGGNRYFIDMYSMSFAVEDRARILEYACMTGNGEYFISKAMQAKLRCICSGIREAFQLPEGSYIWEQYLNE